MDLWQILPPAPEGTHAQPIESRAGLVALSGIPYIDSVTMHGADEAGDSTLESRTYTLQNWRADMAVAAKVGTSGAFVCRGYVVYEAYGKATSEPLNSADFNGDDGVDDLDNTAFYAAFSNGDPEADLNLDDAIDDLDITAWNAIFQSGVIKEPGSGALSGLLMGYAGYMRDGSVDMYHVRHRVYDTELGRWTRRDPLGYVDGMSVYGYVSSMGITVNDPMGLAGSVTNPKGAVSAAISMLLAAGRYTTRALIEELCRMGLGAFAKYIAAELGVDVSLVEEICGAIGGKKPPKVRPAVSPGVKNPQSIPDGTRTLDESPLCNRPAKGTNPPLIKTDPKKNNPNDGNPNTTKNSKTLTIAPTLDLACAQECHSRYDATTTASRTIASRS